MRISARAVIIYQVWLSHVWFLCDGSNLFGQEQDNHEILAAVESRVRDFTGESASAALRRDDRVEVIAGLCWILSRNEAPIANVRDSIVIGRQQDADVDLLIQAIQVRFRGRNDGVMERFSQLPTHIQAVAMLNSGQGPKASKVSLVGITCAEPLVRALACRTMQIESDDDFRRLQACLADGSVLVRTECLLCLMRQQKQISQYGELLPSAVMQLQHVCLDDRDSVYLEDYLTRVSLRELSLGEILVESYILSEVSRRYHPGVLPVWEVPTAGVSCVGTLGFRSLSRLDRPSAIRFYDEVFRRKSPSPKGMDKALEKLRRQIGELGDFVR